MIEKGVAFNQNWSIIIFVVAIQQPTEASGSRQEK